MPLQGSLSIERMCQLAGVSRAGFYRSLQERAPVEEDMEMRSVIQQIAVEHRRRYGYRRISAELRRRGMLVNHKRVLRILGQDNLLAVRRGRSWGRRMAITSSGVSESGQSHETEGDESVLDSGYYLPSVEEGVCLPGGGAGLVFAQGGGMGAGTHAGGALADRGVGAGHRERQPRPGLVHHSDRGVQYACGDYAQVLQRSQMIPSMSRAGNPYDNASCESFMKTLKQEEIYANDYRDMEHLRENIEEFIERYYNRCRLHSALGYRPPEEFERDASRR